MNRGANIWTKVDWVTIFIYLALVFIGWLNIYAAVYSDEHDSIFDVSQRYGKQMIWIGAAFLIIVIIMLFDIRFFTFFSYILFAVTALLLLFVAFFGKEVNGARSWFALGSFHFQPTEFAKVATALAVAKYLSSFNIKINTPKTLITVGVLILIPIFLIMLQPDFGSVIVYFSFMFVLYREGFPGKILFYIFLVICIFVMSLVVSKVAILIVLVILTLALLAFVEQRLIAALIGAIVVPLIYYLLNYLNYLFSLNFSIYLILLIAASVAAVGLIVFAFVTRYFKLITLVGFLTIAVSVTYSVEYLFNNLMEDHQKKRVNILLGKETDLRGAEYNVNQSKIAIGSGGFFGKGFLQGTQTKYNFVPEQSTDFIFCTVGEEWGFVGSIFVIMLFAGLLIRLLFLAERQRSAFSRIYGYGVVSILFFHVAINIGMTIGILPVIGIPLPFFSYGGSSLWAFTALLFIFLRFDASRLELLR